MAEMLRNRCIQATSEQSALKYQLNKAQKFVCLIAVLHSVSELPDIHTDDFHDNSIVSSQESVHA